jgi:murein DD-endopeptidase MepM/ murein hydrolase activator NlpD
MPIRHRLLAVAALVCAGLLTPAASASGTAVASAPTPDLSAGSDDAPDWRLPWPDAVVARPYEAPAHRYGPGHRGIDLAASGPPAVLAPAAGAIAFAGRVVDRGVVTVDHGGGWVTTVEPVETAVAVGAAVAAGDRLGVLATGGHTATGMLHVGVRHDGEYVNPLGLLREIPRAVLLPCC